MSNNKGMPIKSYTPITSWHSSNTPSACGGDHLFVSDPYIRVFAFLRRGDWISCCLYQKFAFSLIHRAGFCLLGADDDPDA